MANQVIDIKNRKGSEKKPKSYRRMIVWSILALIALGAIVALVVFVNKPPKPETQLELSGRIEGPESRIGPTMAGRVKSVPVREGDVVHKGQLILSLDSHVVKAKANAAQAGINAARKAEAEAAGQARVLESAAYKTKPKGVFGKMFGGISGRKAKTEKLRLEAMGAESKARVAHAKVAQAQAARDAVTANLTYFDVTSPIDGVCTTRNVEPGDLVAPGQVLLTIVDMNHLYFRGFIPESKLPKVEISQRAKVILDAAPSAPLTAKVSSIDKEASFTPENVYFKEDKVKQVFGVELAIDHPGGLAKPGMSAAAVIQLGKGR